MARKTKKQIFKEIEMVLRDSKYTITSKGQITRVLGIRWETINNAFEELIAIDIIKQDPKTKQYYWAVVPMKFWRSEKENYERYIDALENRLIKYKWMNKRVHDSEADNLPALIRLLEECQNSVDKLHKKQYKKYKENLKEAK